MKNQKMLASGILFLCTLLIILLCIIFQKETIAGAQFDPINHNEKVSLNSNPLKNAVKSKPYNEYLAKARGYKGTYNYENAIKYYKKALEKDPGNIIIIEELASTYYAADQFKNIISLYEAFQVNNDLNACSYTTLSLAYAENNDFTKSLATLKKAVERDPTSSCIPNTKKNIDLIYHAHIYEGLRKRNYNEIGQYARARLMLDNNNASAHYYTGISFLKNGNKSKAIKHFNMSIALDESYKRKINNFIESNS